MAKQLTISVSQNDAELWNKGVIALVFELEGVTIRVERGTTGVWPAELKGRLLVR